ncbi:MAG: hypothetical protein GY734_01430 [Herbaspirillum sp.]|uniref:hypothetical protein n=1 Tax=Herbaspirillum sp. TaxID=1890675 RepID=UPI002583D972|nr:hypothetical protein [Herbaspirillum sp.]MCP3656997.1 hypothetical protein [Herbaspirillum sp.]MCP3947663.1 hypothetical protein [Herbaspirillum sp.]MCP4029888.1 hypothetical protein [Herbaspirillum sp.]MCP4557254.1 hypothetical protein [Herbaspirillum sp.]
MFITFPSWQVEGVPRALLAPAIPWRSALIDAGHPCFLIAPQVDSLVPQTHVRLFSDIDELLTYVHEEFSNGCVVHVLSSIDESLSVKVVTAIGAYLCPQTGIKLRVYFDENNQPWPAHSGQPQFCRQLDFDIEANFVASKYD